MSGYSGAGWSVSRNRAQTTLPSPSAALSPAGTGRVPAPAVTERLDEEQAAPGLGGVGCLARDRSLTAGIAHRAHQARGPAHEVQAHGGVLAFPGGVGRKGVPQRVGDQLGHDQGHVVEVVAQIPRGQGRAGEFPCPAHRFVPGGQRAGGRAGDRRGVDGGSPCRNGSSIVDPFVPMRGTPGIRGCSGTASGGHCGYSGTTRTSTQVREDHGSECAGQMQGQMHVHARDLPGSVPVRTHFFRFIVLKLSESLPVSVIE